MSPSTLQRIERGDRQLKTGEALLIEKKTGVPVWFLEGGWENYPGSIDDLGRQALEDIEPGDEDQRKAGGADV